MYSICLDFDATDPLRKRVICKSNMHLMCCIIHAVLNTFFYTVIKVFCNNVIIMSNTVNKLIFKRGLCSESELGLLSLHTGTHSITHSTRTQSLPGRPPRLTGLVNHQLSIDAGTFVTCNFRLIQQLFNCPQGARHVKAGVKEVKRGAL